MNYRLLIHWLSTNCNFQKDTFFAFYQKKAISQMIEKWLFSFDSF